MTVPCRGKLSRRALVIGLALAMGTGAVHAAGALKVWRHGIVEAKGDSSILFMPARGGFAEKRGIDLQLVQFVVGTTPVRALVAGQLESFEGSPVVALAAMHQGADIKIVGCHWPVMTYSVFARADINSISDLRGKTVGVSAPGSLPDLFIREALESGGLKDTDVRYANAGSSTDRFKAVAAGVVDAAGSSSEFEIEAGARGSHARCIPAFAPGREAAVTRTSRRRTRRGSACPARSGPTSRSTRSRSTASYPGSRCTPGPDRSSRR